MSESGPSTSAEAARNCDAAVDREMQRYRAPATTTVRGAAIGGGFRGAALGGGFRSAAIGRGFRGSAFRGRFVGARSFAFRPGFAPRVNRFAFGRFHRFRDRRFFAFAAAPFVAGVGLYGASCLSWQPTPWGWQRVWACDYDYGYY